MSKKTSFESVLLAATPRGRLQLEQQVRVSDLNYGGHLGYAQMIQLIHNARVAFLAQYNLSELDIFGLGLIMLNTSVDYKSECFLGENLMFDVKIQMESAMKLVFITTATKPEQNDKIAAIAKDTLAFFDFKKHRLAKTPSAFKKLLEI